VTHTHAAHTTDLDAEAVLVDPRFGIVHHLVDDPRRGGMPAAQRQWVAHVSDTTAFGAPAVDRLAFGNSTDASAARGAALGEAVERYCGNLVPTDLPLATWNELDRAGHPAVDPGELALFAPHQYDTAGFPFRRFTRDTPVAWARGVDLCSQAPVSVPASTVYLNLRAGTDVNPLPYAGIATGPSVRDAQRGALHEVVERDATAIWWSAHGPSVLIADGDEAVAAFDDLAADDRTVRLLALPNAFDLPVVAAFVEDHRRELIGFGTACRHDARDAASKALTEAFGLVEVAADLADPASPLWDAHRAGLLPAGTFKPFRADRAYRSSYRADLRDLVDLPGIAQLYLDPDMRGAPLDRLRTHAGTTSFAALDRVPGGDLLDDLVDRIVAHGLRAVSVDLTTSDVAASGLHVARVVVPGAYGNSPPAFPYLGGRRRHDVPKSLGWASPPPATGAALPAPIPLA
jgi:ribosomal protein S12 methylthiotransferase accessory factor